MNPSESTELPPVEIPQPTLAERMEAIGWPHQDIALAFYIQIKPVWEGNGESYLFAHKCFDVVGKASQFFEYKRIWTYDECVEHWKQHAVWTEAYEREEAIKRGDIKRGRGRPRGSANKAKQGGPAEDARQAWHKAVTDHKAAMELSRKNMEIQIEALRRSHREYNEQWKAHVDRLRETYANLR